MIIEIKSQKQENGVWGMPQNVVYIEAIFPCEDTLLNSAIIMAISQTYSGETFGIYFITKKGFKVQLSHSGWKSINYSDYSLDRNILSYKKQ